MCFKGLLLTLQNGKPWNTDISTTNPELPAQVDPTDIKSNFKKAILNRTQTILSKPILQVSGEFEPNPCYRSNPQHFGLALPFPCLVPQSTAEWHQGRKKNCCSRPRPGTATHPGAVQCQATTVESLYGHRCRRATTVSISTPATDTSVRATSARIHSLGRFKKHLISDFMYYLNKC